MNAIIDLPPTPGLTRRQRQCLNVTVAFVRTNGHSPSYEEITRGLGNTSKASTFALVSKLVERGYVRRTAKLSRSITFELPEASHAG